MSLIEIYNRINSPKDTNVYNTDKISNHHNHLIGINSKKQVAIIFDACEPSGSNDNLTNISLQHNLSCGIYDKFNKRIDKKVSIILCKSDDEKVKRLFLKSLEGTVLGLQSIISQKEIDEFFKALIKLFEKISNKRETDLIGLWGELFIIYNCKDYESLKNIINAWHPENEEIFDFYMGNEGIEIKTTIQGNRKHHFSYEQLSLNNNKIIIASILLRITNSGYSVKDLKEKIEKSLKDQIYIDKINYLYDIITINSTEEQINKTKFDLDWALRNIVFFDQKNVPKINERLQQGVSNVKFISDLTNSNNIENIENYKILKNLNFSFS